MEIKNLILKILSQKGKVLTRDIVKKTGFSRAYVYRIVQEMCDEGKLSLIGKANRAHYVAADKTAIERSFKDIADITLAFHNKNLQEDEVLAKIKKTTGIFLHLKQNIQEVLRYAFLEMLNNAIEHSRSARIGVRMERSSSLIHFSVTDHGVGIFNNIMRLKRLESPTEAIEALLKGKQTTAPEAHSGEGIFFTSKVADKLTIRSGKKKLVFDNLLKDIVVRDGRPFAGTKVDFVIATDSKSRLDEVFHAYADDSFAFSTTDVHVRLFRQGADHISRSQARRIISGLEKFKTIHLDFQSVDTIGQAFADELFRVWANAHPDKKIDVQNSNDNIDLMIRRARNG